MHIEKCAADVNIICSLAKDKATETLWVTSGAHYRLERCGKDKEIKQQNQMLIVFVLNQVIVS
jgi:hypothetical protein